MSSFERLNDDEQLFWQPMVAAFREVERNIKRNLRTRTGLTFADFILLIVLHEVGGGTLHVDKIYDRLERNHLRVLLHTSRLEKRGSIHIEDHDEDPGSDYAVVPTGIDRHVFAEVTPDYMDTIREEATSPLTSEDREVMLKYFQAVLDRK